MRAVFKCSWLLCISVCMLTASVIPAEHRGAADHFDDDGEHDLKVDHEAFLGKDEAAEYDDLSPEQSKERLAKLIPKIDADNDGQITEDELKKHVDFMQRRYVDQDVQRTWANYDAEKTAGGLLKWTDYRDMVYGPETSEVSDEYKKMTERDRTRWLKADLNSDDKMDQKEYACFMHPEDCEHMKDTIVGETMEDIDKDGDGTVSLEEYIGDMYRAEDYPELKGKEPDWVASERQMFKEQRDTNGDGKLDAAEMREWITPTDFDHAEAEARHLLHMADDDKDGALTADEILAHYDVFVGSQATDYGEQLQKHDPGEL